MDINNIVENILNLTIFWLEWIPAFIVYAFIFVSAISFILSFIKKSLALIIIIFILNFLAWLWVFEIVNNLIWN